MKLSIAVVPRSSQNELITLPGGTYKAKLKAAPVDGAANKMLIELLSETFGVSKSRIAIVGGLRGKKKIVEIT